MNCRIEKIPYYVPRRSVIRNSPIILLVLLYRFAGERRTIVYTYCAMFVVALLISLISPYVVGNFIQEIAENRNVDGAAKKFFFSIITLEASFWLLHGVASSMEKFTAFIVEGNYRNHLFKTLTILPLEWHGGHHTGESIAKVNKAAASLFRFTNSFSEIIYIAFRVLGTCFALWLISPAVSFLAGIMFLVCVALILIFDLYLVRQLRRLNEFAEFVSSAVHDYINNVATVLTLRLQKRAGNVLKQRILAPAALFNQNSKLEATKWGITYVLFSVIVAGTTVYWIHAQRGSATFSIASLYMVFDYLRRISDSVYTLAWRYSETMHQSVDVRAALVIEDAYFKYFSAHDDNVVPITKWRKIEINNLNFAYPNSDKKALCNVNFVVEKGKKIALVGESGSGKSTFMSVIRGMHKAQELTVVVDGQPSRDGLVPIEDSIELLPQSPEVFNESIAFNVVFGFDATESAILKAIDTACFRSVLDKLPRGLSSHVHEKGVNLSGGERQRLALSRGIFFASDKELILLDEATSSVDPVNERHIYENISKEFKDKCIVCSIHRLNLLDLFDYVYVFAQGRVVEEGAPTQLLSDGTSALSKMHQSLSKTSEL